MMATSDPPQIGYGRAVKRQKVRKGTQSCWECKRRKVRCLFASDANTICDNCTRRNTSCVSQEYIDDAELELPKKRSYTGVEARLSRVEDVLQQLLQKADPACIPPSLPDEVPDVTRPENLAFSSDEAVLTAASRQQHPERPLSDSHTGLSKKLMEGWPSQAELLDICALLISFSTHSHMNLSDLNASDPSHEPISTRQILQLPPPGSHPVLIARKLLILGSLLQDAMSKPQLSPSLRERFKTIASGAIDTAIRLVTTDDTLTASMEGVECIMIEAMIHNYAGNLHRAWLANRRAAAVAQIIGLHRGNKSSAYRILDPGTKPGLHPDVLCFRVVEMDRYLSVTLGLPQSSLETRALEPESLAKCSPIERLARRQCIIAGEILNYEHSPHLPKTSDFMNETEASLQQAACEMPPKWWTVPDLSPVEDATVDLLQDITRINYQFSHYHLVMRLHLPYMLGASQYTHSNIAAANAGRETLSRYVTFRRWNPGHFYCRGVDYLAFISLAVLCLAHIDASSSIFQDELLNIDVVKLLTQSRHSDRGIMERTLDILKDMDNDTTASKLASIMQHLLDAEDAAAKGVGYDVVGPTNKDGQTEYEGCLEKDNVTLKLCIPYFGTIILRHKATSTLLDQPQTTQWDYTWSQQPSLSHYYANTSDSNNSSMRPMDKLQDSDEFTLQSINDSLFGSLFGGRECRETFLNLENISAQNIDTLSRTT